MEPNDIVGTETVEQTEQPQVVEQQQPTNDGNPAWSEIYEVLPESLHTVVRPVLDKWEQGTQTKFNQYAEEAKRYDPYKDFVEKQISPEQIRNAMAVAQMIDADPRAFMSQLQAYLGETPAPQQQQTQQQPQKQGEDGDFSFDEVPFDIANDPRFKQIAEQQQVMANYLASQLEEQQKAQQDAELDRTLSSLKQTYGDYDENYVLGLMLNGKSPEDAVKSYKEIENRIRNAPRADANVPNIVTPGGGMPQENFDPASLSAADRKKLVMDMLQQANQQQ